MFVTAEDFATAPYQIPDLGDELDGFLAFVDRIEAEVLEKIFGPLFFQEIEVNWVIDPLLRTAEWNFFFDGGVYVYSDGKGYRFPGLKNLLIPYVYAMWLRDGTEHISSTGAVTQTHENSNEATPRRRFVNAYNSFVRMLGFSMYSRHYKWGVYNTFHSYLTFKNLEYPNWRHTDFDLVNYWDL